MVCGKRNEEGKWEIYAGSFEDYFPTSLFDERSLFCPSLRDSSHLVRVAGDAPNVPRYVKLTRSDRKTGEGP